MICTACIVNCCLIVKFLHTLLGELDHVRVITEKLRHMHGQHMYVGCDMPGLVDGCEIFHPLFSIFSKTLLQSWRNSFAEVSYKGEKNPSIDPVSSQHRVAGVKERAN